MPRIKLNNRFLYVFFVPWAKKEVSLTGAFAQIFVIVVLIAIITGYTNVLINWKTMAVSGVYALLKNFV